MVGASALKDIQLERRIHRLTVVPLRATETLFANTQPNFFAIYEKNKIMVATEYTRSWGNQLVQFPATPAAYSRNDDCGWYVMAMLQSYVRSSRREVTAAKMPITRHP